MFYCRTRGDKRRPLSRIISLWADGQMTPFYRLVAEPALSSPAQSFKSVKVSKFKVGAAYMRLTCTQGEHLHVLKLQRGVGWVQGFAVVCHVHVCYLFRLTNPQLLDSGTEKLVQESSVPPTPLLLLFHLPFSHPPHTSANPPPSSWAWLHPVIEQLLSPVECNRDLLVSEGRAVTDSRAGVLLLLPSCH